MHWSLQGHVSDVDTGLCAAKSIGKSKYITRGEALCEDKKYKFAGTYIM